MRRQKSYPTYEIASRIKAKINFDEYKISSFAKFCGINSRIIIRIMARNHNITTKAIGDKILNALDRLPEFYELEKKKNSQKEAARRLRRNFKKTNYNESDNCLSIRECIYGKIKNPEDNWQAAYKNAKITMEGAFA